jgi:hypothetical protein
MAATIAAEWILGLTLVALLGYLVFEEVRPPTVGGAMSRARLCEYYAAGSVYEPVSEALARGIRLLEVHIYSDEDDHPMVATKAVSEGYDIAYDNVSFESVCVDLVNDAFPSPDPCILSIVFHTDKTTAIDRVADHLSTITRRHLIPDSNVVEYPIDGLANKLVIVSGGPINGTKLESMTNINWSGSYARRLTYQQALYPRDPHELTAFNKNGISIVAGDDGFSPSTVHPHTPVNYGCQWNFFIKGPGGFLPKTTMRK